MSALSEVFKNGLFLRSGEFWKLRRECEKAGVTGERREGKGALPLWASLLTQEKAERLRFYGKEQGKEGGRERKKRGREEQREVTGRSIRSLPLFESIGARSACKGWEWHSALVFGRESWAVLYFRLWGIWTLGFTPCRGWDIPRP